MSILMRMYPTYGMGVNLAKGIDFVWQSRREGYCLKNTSLRRCGIENMTDDPEKIDKRYNVDALGGKENEPRFAERVQSRFFNVFLGPAIWFKEKVVDPARVEEYPWYHRKYQRVPTIDQCDVRDIVCRQEAQIQFARDKKVEEYIVKILRKRMDQCYFYEHPYNSDKNPGDPCYEVAKTYNDCAKNFYIKYGDMAHFSRVEDYFMKQKHRLIWERRHGEVGTGMKSE